MTESPIEAARAQAQAVLRDRATAQLPYVPMLIHVVGDAYLQVASVNQAGHVDTTLIVEFLRDRGGGDQGTYAGTQMRPLQAAVLRIPEAPYRKRIAREYETAEKITLRGELCGVRFTGIPQACHFKSSALR
ncbi:MAG: hypothetical protein U0Y68_23915 [Blastocatellia bacterium]